MTQFLHITLLSKLLGACFPHGALSVIPLTSDVGKRDGIPFPNVRTLGSCITPAPSTAGAVAQHSAGACLTSASSWHFIPERRKNNNPSLLLNPICWLRQPPLTFVKSTALQSSTVLGRKKWHGWRSVAVMNAPIASWRLESGVLSLSFSISSFFDSPRKAFLSHLRPGPLWDPALSFGELHKGEMTKPVPWLRLSFSGKAMFFLNKDRPDQHHPTWLWSSSRSPSCLCHFLEHRGSVGQEPWSHSASAAPAPVQLSGAFAPQVQNDFLDDRFYPVRKADFASQRWLDACLV